MKLEEENHELLVITAKASEKGCCDLNATDANMQFAFQPSFRLSSFSISQYLTAHQFYLVRLYAFAWYRKYSVVSKNA